MKTIKDDHDLYLKCDAFLFDVFEKFRNNCLQNYGLFSSHYLRARSPSWNAMLKMTKVAVQLIPDPNMYIFFEKGTRVRLSYICYGYSIASKIII